MKKVLTAAIVAAIPVFAFAQVEHKPSINDPFKRGSAELSGSIIIDTRIDTSDNSDSITRKCMPVPDIGNAATTSNEPVDC